MKDFDALFRQFHHEAGCIDGINCNHVARITEVAKEFLGTMELQALLNSTRDVFKKASETKDSLLTITGLAHFLSCSFALGYLLKEWEIAQTNLTITEQPLEKKDIN